MNNPEVDVFEMLTLEAKEIFNNEFNLKKNKAYESMWGEYLKVLDKNKYNGWIGSDAYEQLLIKLELISLFYIKWFESDQLFHYMNKYFSEDRIDPNGEHFKILDLIIGDSVIQPKISGFFYDLISEKNISNKNYILKSVCYNNKKLINYVETNKSKFYIEKIDGLLYATNIGLIQNSGLSFAFSQVLDEVDMIAFEKANQSISSNVISERLHAQIALLFNKTGENLRNHPIAFGIQMLNKQNFVQVSYVGPARRINEVIIELEKGLYSSIGNKNGNNKIRSSAFQSKLATIMNYNAIKDPNINIKFECMVDKKLLLSNRNITSRSSRSIFDYSIDKNYSKTVFDTLQKNYKSANALGVLATALQSIAIFKAYDTLKKEDFNDSKLFDAQVQMIAQPLILVGSIMDFWQRRIAIYNNYPISISEGRIINLGRDITKYTARVGLYGGASLLALLEYKNAYISLKRNNITSAVFDFTYGTSLILSTYLLRRGTTLMSARLLGLGATGWGIVLIVIGFGLDYYSDYVRRKQLKYWLDESYWGNSNKNFTLEISQEKYGLAVKEVSGE